MGSKVKVTNNNIFRNALYWRKRNDRRFVVEDYSEFRFVVLEKRYFMDDCDCVSSSWYSKVGWISSYWRCPHVHVWHWFYLIFPVILQTIDSAQMLSGAEKDVYGSIEDTIFVWHVHYWFTYCPVFIDICSLKVVRSTDKYSVAWTVLFSKANRYAVYIADCDLFAKRVSVYMEAVKCISCAVILPVV